MQPATGVSCSRLATCINRDRYVKSVMKTIHAEGAANKLVLCFKFRNEFTRARIQGAAEALHNTCVNLSSPNKKHRQDLPP